MDIHPPLHRPTRHRRRLRINMASKSIGPGREWFGRAGECLGIGVAVDDIIPPAAMGHETREGDGLSGFWVEEGSKRK